MASSALGRGARILGSAPWLPLVAGTATAGLLLLAATVAHRTGFVTVATLLGLAACGGAAAYVLDEESSAVLDATPTSRARRIAWRLPLVALPGTVALVALLALDRVDSPTHWLRLVPLAAGSLALGVGFAAALRRSGSAAPGDLAGVLAVGVVVLLVAVNPLGRWASVAPLGDTAHPGRSALVWAAVVLAAAAVTLLCSRDPVTRRHRDR